VNDQTKAYMSTITIVACLALLGVLAHLKVEGIPVAAVAVVTTVIAWMTRPPDKIDPPGGAKIVPILAVGAIVSSLFMGCSDKLPPAANVENAAAVAQYELLLADCRAKGKTAQNYAVYETCADAVDAELCRAHGLLCKDGGAK